MDNNPRISGPRAVQTRVVHGRLHVPSPAHSPFAPFLHCCSEEGPRNTPVAVRRADGQAGSMAMTFPRARFHPGLVSRFLLGTPKKERRWMRERGDGLFLGMLASCCCCCLHADDTWDSADTLFMPSAQG